MVVILYSVLNRRLETDIFDHYMGQLPYQMQEKILKCKRWQDVQASLIGKSLLIMGIEKFGFQKRMLNEIQYSEYMRPYFPNNICFNISHSGNCVVCAISSNFQIGIDVEEIRPITISDFKSQFNEHEMSKIFKANDKLFAFYDLWTKKEAIVKADGSGMSTPFISVIIGKTDEVILKERKWYIKKINLNSKYCANVASAARLYNGVMLEEVFL